MRIPIGIRLGIGVILLQLILVAWMTWDSRTVASAALAQQQTMRVAELSALLNDALAPLLVQRDFAALQDVLDNVGRAEGLEYLLLYDHHGNPVAQHSQMSAEELAVLRSMAENLPLLDVSVAIELFGQEYGQLHVGFSTQVYEQTRDELMQRGVRNALVGIVLLSLLIIPISLCLSRRLGSLGRAAQAISDGDLGQRLEDRGHDELGQLAAAFNRMASSLEQRMDELDRAGEEREKVIVALDVANRDLQRLSEVTAHHMREPLRRLMTWSQRLARQCADLPDGEGLLESVTVIGEQARRMAALVQDVERYLSAGMPQGELGEQELAPLLASRLRRVCVEHGIDGVELEQGVLPPLYIDRPRLGLLLELLLDNAVSYRPPDRSLRLVVEGIQLGNMTTLRLSDNGPGIASGYRERVFNIFERLENAGKGTGAGLAIARRIVESLGGRIWLEAAPGSGTTVAFELPSKRGSSHEQG